VSRAERDLVDAIRAELAAIDPARPCDRAAERAGLATATSARDPALARLWVRLARGPDAGPATTSPGGSMADFAWDAGADHCRFAWLRGLFLARGSLIIANSQAHLEFVVDPAAATELSRRLADAGLPASVRVRRGRGVVTWKGGDVILTFLRRVGASGTALELEARQVSRALRGELNRVMNAESANVRRSVAAAGRQLAAIEALAANGQLAAQPAAVRRVADARRATPEASLTDLAERLGVHRSRVQRALERIERLALGAGVPLA
jgi:DNA-binding transcriptional regulator WhiA